MSAHPSVNIAWITLVALLFAGAAYAGPKAAGNRNAEPPGRFAALRATAAETGPVAVIVRLVEDATASASAAAPRALTAKRSGEWRKRKRMARLAQRRDAVARTRDAFLSRHNLTPEQAKPATYFPFVALEADAALLDELADSPLVQDVTVDHLNHTSLSATLPVIGANTVQALGYDGSGYDIAILDTGVQTDHPMLAPNIAMEEVCDGGVCQDQQVAACFSSAKFGTVSLCPSGIPSCQDANGADISHSACGTGAAEPCNSLCGHGTHVAGIAAGTTAAGGSETGVAPGSGIIPVNVFVKFDSNGDGSLNAVGAWDSDIIRGLEYVLRLAATRDIAAVNMSLGGGVYTTTAGCDAGEAPMKTVIDQLRAAGVATVVAAGNNGRSDGLSGPGCISSAISVGSTDNNDNISSFSNESTALTLHAPGQSVRAAYPWDSYARLGGTSMATPHVAGAVALLQQRAYNFGIELDVDNAVAALQQTGTEMYGGAFKVPRIDLAAAIETIDATPPHTVIVDDQLHGDQVAVLQGAASPKSNTNAYGGQALRGNTAAAPNVVRYSPVLPTAGYYTVSAMWPVLPGNGSAIDVTISHANGTDSLSVNQTAGGAQWQELGTYFFPAGHAGYVQLSDADGGRLSADAIRFEYDGVVMSITTEQLPDGILDVSYSTTLRAFGGMPAYTWGLVAGSLPNGLGVDASSGQITGIPTATGDYDLTIAVSDAQGTKLTQPLTLTIQPPIHISGAIELGDLTGDLSTTASTPADITFAVTGSGACTMNIDGSGYSCDLPEGWSGTIWPTALGYSFEPATRSYTDVKADLAAQDFTAIAMSETVWFDDSVPAGAQTATNNDVWEWVSSDPAAFSGSLAHRSSASPGIHFHGFNNASDTLAVSEGDTLFTYVYIDPLNPTRSISLHIVPTEGSAVRAYWGEDLRRSPNWDGFVDGTPEWMPMGDLPAAGQWVRLEVPAALLELEGKALRGIYFSLYDGRASFDRTGVAQTANSTTDVTISGTITSQADGRALGGVEFSGAECTASGAAGDYSCTVASGWSGSIVPALSGYGFTPSAYDYSAVETDQVAQDFVAVADPVEETVWFDDSVPAGAQTATNNDVWEWVSSDPAAFSGSLAHRSSASPGIHFHGFNNASDTLAVSEGDTLFTYVYIDPLNPTRSISLHIVPTEGSAVRAYWGEDLRRSPNWDGFVDGTPEWMPMGDLPAAGQWVRLEVPAALLELEGKALRGIYFSLYDGRASFDRTGVAQTANSTTDVTISGTITSQADGRALGGVEFSGAECTASGAAGDYSCTVASGWSGSIVPALSGYGFTPSAYDYSAVETDQVAQDFVAVADPVEETVWFDDSVPAGAQTATNNDVWEWVSSNPAAFSGSLAHRSSASPGIHFHGFNNASDTLAVSEGDTLFTYVYIDPLNPTRSISLHIVPTEGSAVRAYWGEDLRRSPNWDGFVDGTPEWMPMGDLPAAGQWVRLEVPAALLELEGKALRGIYFSLYDGRASFDRTGTAR